MDPEVTTVAMLVHPENDQAAEKWFTALVGVMSSDSRPADVDGFLAAFIPAAEAAGFSGSFTDDFKQRVNDYRITIDMIAKTAALPLSELMAERARVMAEWATVRDATPAQAEKLEPTRDAEGRWWKWDTATGGWVYEVELVNGVEYQYNENRSAWVPLNPWHWNDAAEEWSYFTDGAWARQVHQGEHGELKLARNKTDWIPVAAPAAAPVADGAQTPAAAEGAGGDGHAVFVDDVVSPILEDVVKEFGELSEAELDAIAAALHEELESLAGAESGGQQ